MIFYSQGEVAKFVNWIKEQDFYPDKTAVITGDHKSMANEFFADCDPSYRRSVVNLYLNSARADPGPQITKNREYASVDIAPTILESAGYILPEGRFGVGISLFSGRQTLIERDGLEAYDQAMMRQSSFYNDHVVAFS